MKTIAGAAAVLTLVASSAQAGGKDATTYTLTDLGTLSSPSTAVLCGPDFLSVGVGNSAVNSISDNGEAVGTTASAPPPTSLGFTEASAGPPAEA